MNTTPTEPEKVVDLNVWENSVAVGISAEALFLAALRGVGYDVVSNNLTNVKAMDYLIQNQFADLKFLTSPYIPKGGKRTPSGLTPEEHLTLDVSNVTKYPSLAFIFMVVDYTKKGVATKGIYWITAGEVRQIMKENPGRKYLRSERTRMDKVSKVGISTNDCRLLYLDEIDTLDLAEKLIAQIGVKHAA